MNSLDLSNNNIGVINVFTVEVGEFQKIAKKLDKVMDNLTHLNISNNEIGNKVMEIISHCKFLRNFTHL